MKKSRIPSALNYWTEWAILRSNDGVCVLIFGDTDGNGIREKDFSKHFSRITSGEIAYITDLIEESPLNLDDQTLREWLPVWERRWSLLASTGNKDAGEKLDRLSGALKGSHRGKTPVDDLKEIISRDIEVFKSILEQRKISNESIEKIIMKLARPEKYDRVQQIYKTYKNLLDKCLPVLSVLENFFILLEDCRNNIVEPVCIVIHEDIGFIFVKGEAKDGRLSLFY